MNKFVYFESDFIDSEPENGIALQVHIDGYPEDENKAGATVAKVIQTESGDIATVWQDNAYRMNDSVLELVNNAIDNIKDGVYNSKATAFDKEAPKSAKQHKDVER